MKTVPLHGKKAAGRAALVDDEDYDLVMQYRWNLAETRRPWTFYARAGWRENGRVKTIRMHILIMGHAGIDHADGNGLNNQRQNLRIATPSQNVANTGPRPGTSSYKGVRLDRVSQRWRAAICINGKCVNLGRFATETEAALAYDAAARKLFGEFARPNFPDRQEAS